MLFCQKILGPFKVALSLNPKQKDIDVRCGCPSSREKKTLSWYLMIIMLFIPVIIITWCYIKIIKSAKFLAKKLGESRTRGRSIGSTPKMKRPSPCSSESGSTTALHFASSQNTIRKPRISTATQNNNRQKRMSEFNSNLNLMVFLMVVAVVVCWLPFHVLNLSWAYGLRVRLNHFQIAFRSANYFLRTGLCEFLQSAARFLTWFHPLVNCLLYSFMGKKFRKELRHTIYRVRTMRKRGIENDSQFLR